MWRCSGLARFSSFPSSSSSSSLWWPYSLRFAFGSTLGCVGPAVVASSVIPLHFLRRSTPRNEIKMETKTTARSNTRSERRRRRRIHPHHRRRTNKKEQKNYLKKKRFVRDRGTRFLRLVIGSSSPHPHPSGVVHLNGSPLATPPPRSTNQKAPHHPRPPPPSSSPFFFFLFVSFLRFFFVSPSSPRPFRRFYRVFLSTSVFPFTEFPRTLADPPVESYLVFLPSFRGTRPSCCDLKKTSFRRRPSPPFLFFFFGTFGTLVSRGDDDLLFLFRL